MKRQLAILGALLLFFAACGPAHPGMPDDTLSTAPTGEVSLQAGVAEDDRTDLRIFLANGRYTPVHYTLGCPAFDRFVNASDGWIRVDPAPFCRLDVPSAELPPLQAHLRDLPENPVLPAGTYRLILAVDLGTRTPMVENVVSDAFVVPAP